jgi:hypothetical protein
MQANQSMPRNFVQELDHEQRQIHAYSIGQESAGGHVEEVIDSKFKADAYMAGQIINGTAVMTMTRNSDIPIIAGDCCISIRTFTKGNYEIVSTSQKTLWKAKPTLAADSKATFNQTAIPLFKGVANLRLHALMMLIIGCNMYGQDMKGVGGKSLLKMIEQIEPKISEETLFTFLQEQFMMKNKLSEEAVDTYIDAIIFEPTNATPNPQCIDAHSRTYLFGFPFCLPKFLEQYSVYDVSKTNCIVDGPSMLMCNGVGGHTHLFLLHVHDICTKC